MQSFEVEIKSLLGSPERAEELRQRMFALDPQTEFTSKNKQLNHYFIPVQGESGGGLSRLVESVSDLVSEEGIVKLKDFAARAKDFSVRTRQKDTDVILVVKASVDDTTSSNGISRMEFEERVPATLEELDQRLLSAGFVYQAKWSREREEYRCKGSTICLDRNAGYGYLAEFEKVTDDAEAVEGVREDLRELMGELGAEELSQERLERMFSHYNAHWSDYYGTDKIFIIE